MRYNVILNAPNDTNGHGNVPQEVDPYTTTAETAYYECASCAGRITSDEHVAVCPDCGGRMQNIVVSRE